MHAVERLDEGECVSFERLKVGSRGEVSCRSSLCQYKTGMLKSNLTVLREWFGKPRGDARLLQQHQMPSAVKDWIGVGPDLRH